MNESILKDLNRLARIFSRDMSSRELMSLAVDEFRDIFAADRAWLIYPCDPEVPYCNICYEATTEDYPALGRMEGNLQVTENIAAVFRDALAETGPRIHLPETVTEHCRKMAGQFDIRSCLSMVLRMKNDRPWLLSLQQCSYERQWSEQEVDLFEYGARMLADAYDTRMLLETLKNDIAKRQKVDAELIQSEQRFRSLFHHSSISLWLEDYSELNREFLRLQDQGILHLDHYLSEHPEFLHNALKMIRVLDINEASLELFEARDRSQLLDNLQQTFTEKTLETFRSVLVALYGGATRFSVEAQYRTFSNRIINTIVTVDVMPDTDSSMALLTIVDVSRQKDAEKRYLESRERYRMLMETANDAIFVMDALTGVIIEANNKAAELIGRSVWEIVGMHQTELHPPEDREQYRKIFTEAMNTREVLGSHDIFVLHADGRKIPVEISASRTTIGNREVVQAIFHDISKRLEKEERRRLLATAVEQAAESVIITDTKGNIEYVNPAFEKITGYSFREVVGKNPRLLNSGKRPKYYFKLLWDEISRGNVWQGILTNKKKDGTLFEEEATITPVKDRHGRIHHYVAVKRDITKQVVLEKQIRQSQKMQAIGTLAGGIAHDFNNILTAIMGFAELSLSREIKDPFLENNIREVVKAADRAGKLIDQILTFSRQTEKNVASLQMAMVVKEVLKLLRASLPANIEIVQDISSKAMVRADPTQVHQVIMNLCTNAYQAIESEVGTITVSIKSVELDAREGLEIGNLPPGKYVRLQVKDTGKGIPPEFIPRIFEPYFTIRDQNEGTGLGLSVVHGIVNDHGGAVTVESTPGKGSCFSVYFPQVSSGEVRSDIRMSDLAEGKGRLLVVDDEQQIVDYEVQVLQRAGYETEGYTSSIEALKAYHDDPARYDLLITDMAMPDMTGLQLYKEVRRISADTPVLLCTGYSEHVTAESSREMGIDGYLAKPFTAEQLASEVKRLIEKNRGGRKANPGDSQ